LSNTAARPPPLREHIPLSLLRSNLLQMQKTAGDGLTCPTETSIDEYLFDIVQANHYFFFKWLLVF
jgi:hypothetical protein